jgi:hypothetical protein
MKHFKKSFTLLMLLTVIIGSRTSAQDLDLGVMLRGISRDRAKEVMHNSEYTNTGYETGNFLSNPLRLNGKPLDYSDFGMESTGELTVIKEATIHGKTIQVPFYLYLRRDGNKVFIPGNERSDLTRVKINISEILRFAKHGDQLVIEAVRKEDGAVKRILKIPGRGC